MLNVEIGLTANISWGRPKFHNVISNKRTTKYLVFLLFRGYYNKSNLTGEYTEKKSDAP